MSGISAKTAVVGQRYHFRPTTNRALLREGDYTIGEVTDKNAPEWDEFCIGAERGFLFENYEITEIAPEPKVSEARRSVATEDDLSDKQLALALIATDTVTREEIEEVLDDVRAAKALRQAYWTSLGMPRTSGPKEASLRAWLDVLHQSREVLR